LTDKVKDRTMRVTNRSSLQAVMSSSSHLTKNESGGWKWEVNHDGVIWSWYHTYPSPVTENSKNTDSNSTNQMVSTASVRPKYSLVDYWYTVHDGIVIPTSTDY
jgi:hypothetical protein